MSVGMEGLKGSGSSSKGRENWEIPIFLAQLSFSLEMSGMRGLAVVRVTRRDRAGKDHLWVGIKTPDPNPGIQIPSRPGRHSSNAKDWNLLHGMLVLHSTIFSKKCWNFG